MARGRRSNREGSEGGKPVRGLRLAGEIKVGTAVSGGSNSGKVIVSVGVGGRVATVGREMGVGAAAEYGESETSADAG